MIGVDESSSDGWLPDNALVVWTRELWTVELGMDQV